MATDPTIRLQQTIQQQIIDIGAIVDRVADRIKGIIGEGIKAVFEPVAAALQGALDLIAQLVGGLLGDLTTPADLTKGIIEAWLEEWTTEAGLNAKLTGWLAEGLPHQVGLTLQGAMPPQHPDPADALLHDTPEPHGIGVAIDRLRSMPGWAQGLWHSVANVVTIMAYLQMLNHAELAALQQDVSIQTPVTPLGLPDLALSVVQSQVGEDWAKQQALRLGFTPELFDVVLRITGEPPGPETMLELWRRGATDEAGVDQAMRESRLKNKYIDALKELRFHLPPPSDLIRFLVRDAFDDSVASDLGLDTDFEDKFDPAMFFKVGISRDDALRYWRAHWQLPSPTQLFEMHHRTSESASYKSEPINLPSGKTVHRLISADFLRRTLQINDLLPPFLDKYREISFSPPTRVDARRMYLADQFTDDDLYRAFLDEGYTPDFAAQMLQWMQAAKAKAQHEEALKHAAPVITHLRDMYRTGLLDSQEATGSLTELGVEPDIIGLWLRSDDLDRERRRANAIRDDLHRLFVSEFLTTDDVDSRLGNEGFTAAERARILEDWRLDLQLKEASDDQKRMRELTKSHVLDAFKDRRIDRSEASLLLTEMGYHADQVEFWLTDVEWDAAQKDADTVREAIHADYVDQIIERNVAGARLDALNVPAAHKDALLQRWDTERRRKEPRLNIGQVTALAENQVIPPDELVAYLRKLRYQDAEIELLQQLWGYEVGVTRERLDLAREQFQFRKEQAEAARAERAAREERARQERETARQSAESQRLAAEQRAQERQLAAEARRAASQVEAEQRRQVAESARHERTVTEALAREERARQERDTNRQLRVELAERTLSAADERQRRAFEQQDRTLAQRESNLDARYQRALNDRLAAEQRREEAQIARESRLEEARIRAESRAAQARIATEGRGERRQLERELRAQQATMAREERAQAARVAQEQRVAAARSVIAEAQAQAQSQIERMRDAERERLQNAAAERQRRLEEATQRRIGALS